MANDPKYLLDYTLEELKVAVQDLGLPKYTASQLLTWVAQKNIRDYSAMTNISKAHQETLKQKLPISPYTRAKKLPAPDGSAIKYIFELAPKQFVEAVVLQEKDYKTLCISSQCGCPVGCKFCVTGYAGFKTNLSAGQITGQLHYIQGDGHKISNIVYMGMGEPLLNYDSVFKSIDNLTDPKGFGLGKRRITVSTSGYIQGIKRLIADEQTINLAFSVGSPNPINRLQMMPFEKQNPIMKIAPLLKEFSSQHNRQLTLEYTLCEGMNDKKEDAIQLANLATYLFAHVNLINLNPHPSIPYKPVQLKTIRNFHRWIKNQDVSCTLRGTKGQEVVAACGQLGESMLKDF
ncbi:23S rRNA (adenine(2503)-C(2))-methyltransferase RlmN [bacterium]|jgi:23S rRNA (adenine2503-C2)-methyltransferase|nr:23S rRNA (adenine(2503)-C(2))-methyltransferase RlmN [bacterium]